MLSPIQIKYPSKTFNNQLFLRTTPPAFSSFQLALDMEVLKLATIELGLPEWCSENINTLPP
jgi:hypothetical protein